MKGNESPGAKHEEHECLKKINRMETALVAPIKKKQRERLINTASESTDWIVGDTLQSGAAVDGVDTVFYGVGKRQRS